MGAEIREFDLWMENLGQGGIHRIWTVRRTLAERACDNCSLISHYGNALRAKQSKNRGWHYLALRSVNRLDYRPWNLLLLARTT